MASWSLEISAGVAMGALLTLAVGVHVGRGVAYLVCGAGWLFPDLATLGGDWVHLGLTELRTGSIALGRTPEAATKRLQDVLDAKSAKST